MKSVSKIFLVVGVLTLAVFSIPMLAQNQQYPFPGYPPQFAPSRTSRPRPPAPPLVPPAKFNKLENAVPNQYIVVLNDDAVSTSGTANQRRARIADLAKLMLPVGAEIQSVYGTVLRGFCVKLPSETAAIALSNDPRVKYVESDVLGSLTDCQGQTITDEIGLDRIDQVDRPLDGCYTSNRTGSGVTVYDVDTGLRTTHQEFGSRAFLADDEVAKDNITDHCTVTSTNNDCSSHGTSMMGVVGGATYGVAKATSLGAVKVFYQDSNNQEVLQASRVIRGIDWITDYHNDHPTQLAVANCSFTFGSYGPLNTAVTDSIASGITYAIAAGNFNLSLDSTHISPAEVGHVALVSGAENPNNDYRWVDATPTPTPMGSDYGSILSLFSPGYAIPSADASTDTATNSSRGTSRASAATAGVAALYLQGRTGMNDCGSHPITGQSSSTTGAAISTCPDRVVQFIMANSTLNRLSTSGSGAIGTGSPNRLLYIGSIPTTTNFNPIDNQRFFVWQQYGDFEDSQPEPDENITDNCGTGVNVNDLCTDNTTHTQDWRVSTSLAFWVDPNGPYASWFTGSYGLSANTTNTDFIIKCYKRYLRRDVTSSDSGVQF